MRCWPGDPVTSLSGKWIGAAAPQARVAVQLRPDARGMGPHPVPRFPPHNGTRRLPSPSTEGAEETVETPGSLSTPPPADPRTTRSTCPAANQRGSIRRAIGPSPLGRHGCRDPRVSRLGGSHRTPPPRPAPRRDPCGPRPAHLRARAPHRGPPPTPAHLRARAPRPQRPPGVRRPQARVRGGGVGHVTGRPRRRPGRGCLSPAARPLVAGRPVPGPRRPPGPQRGRGEEGRGGALTWRDARAGDRGERPPGSPVNRSRSGRESVIAPIKAAVAQRDRAPWGARRGEGAARAGPVSDALPEKYAFPPYSEKVLFFAEKLESEIVS